MVRLCATAPMPAVSASAIAVMTTRRSSTRRSILDEEDMELPAVGAVRPMILRRIEPRLRGQRRGEALDRGGAVAAHLCDAPEVVVAQEDVGALRVGHGEQ